MRILHYDPSIQKVKALKTDVIPEGPHLQTLEVPPFCKDVTIYVNRSGGGGEPGAGLDTGEQSTFALSRFRHNVRNSDLVATISLKDQHDNSWAQRHSPVPGRYFDQIVIGPMGEDAEAQESAPAEDEATRSEDADNATHDIAVVLAKASERLSKLRLKFRNVKIMPRRTGPIQDRTSAPAAVSWWMISKHHKEGRITAN